MRMLRPQRPLPPPTRRIAVSRTFALDFNKLSHFYDWTEGQVAAEKARVRDDQLAMDDVPRLARVIRALETVAKHYGWTEKERAEWREPLRHPGPDRDYVLTLAMALQNGYRQTPENNFIRLGAWLARNGLDPIVTQGDAP